VSGRIWAAVLPPGRKKDSGIEGAFIGGLYGSRAATGALGGGGSKTGILGGRAPERDYSTNWLKINELCRLLPTASSILGEIARHQGRARVRELKAHAVPYQELSESVLVWHATCIRRGQDPMQGRNGKETDSSFQLLATSW
jgi:hypothetical protein